MKPLILVVDDHRAMAELLADQLADHGYSVRIATGGAEALELAAQERPDAVITDLRMRDVDGFDVLAGIHALDPRVPVLIMTAFGAIDDAVEAMQRGAAHYLTKPFELRQVRLVLERALQTARLRDENARLRRLTGTRQQLHGLIGGSAVMQVLFDRLERLAEAAVPVLIRGESGTGKELVANALHALGPRAKNAFVPVNCTTLPETLLESELFGHARGAFTGAGSARRGLFVEADGGTIFLDEIGDMPPDLQAKLLRVLQTGEVRPVGEDRTIAVDVRVIAATHQPLEDRVAEGRFREDLFYRLDVVPVRVPPLRERPEDVPALAAHFLTLALQENPSSRVSELGPELVSALARRPWPGNVRQLQNAIRRIVVLGAGPTATVDELALLEEIAQPAASSPVRTVQIEVPVPHPWAPDGIVPLKQVQQTYIDFVVDACKGNKSKAARLLEINVSTIHRRLPKSDLD